MLDHGMRRRATASAAAAALCSGVLLAACSSTNATSTPSSEAIATTTPAPETTADAVGSVPPTVAGTPTTAPPSTPATVGANADHKHFDPAAFGPDLVDINPWFPLTPGYQSVREGGVNKGSRRLPHRRVYTVTDVTKEINGVKTVLVLDQDFDGGELAEQALDYVAEDNQGNVWYLGSYTEAYEGGQFVNVNDAWLDGVNGGKAGVLMMANPQTDSGTYAQASVPGEGTAKAKVVKTGEKVCVPFNCYEGVLVIQEGGSEDTYFASGVGGIKLQPKSGDPQETEELINLTQLSAQGLAELSAEALKLDQNASKEASDVFGSSAPAERAR